MTKAPRFEAEDLSDILGECPVHYERKHKTIAAKLNSRIEKWLEGSVEVFGEGEKDFEWSTEKGRNSTHVGLLVGIEPISKGVTKDEIIAALRSAEMRSASDLVSRIEREGIVG
jgi:hypothetical protein